MEFKFIKTATVALIMTISSIVGVANATLITDLTERDWKDAGDKALTYDSSTGLEWLDLTETNGNSILDTEAESYFGEFRWATLLEIENILDSVVIGEGYRNSVTNAVIQNANTFVNMFGVTQSSSTQSITQGVSRGSENAPNEYGLGYVWSNEFFGRVKDPLVNCCYSQTESNVFVGSWLVRAADVPEPSTLAIFALGMIGLASRRFKKQS
jgi:hypothetical protein